MMLDKRAKPISEWTYYVVDHLPTMSNLYRYDTVEEALAKYKELPKDQRSAIGASINGISELDLIHRLANNTPVLVTDFQHPNSRPIWRESKELQSAID